MKQLRKHPRRLPYTPRSKVRSALRQLWLRSRERAAALRRDGYTCQRCGAKQSKARGKEIAVNVHHLDGIDWEALIDLVYERLLVPPDRLKTECVSCHEEEETSSTLRHGFAGGPGLDDPVQNHPTAGAGQGSPVLGPFEARRTPKDDEFGISS